MQQLVSIIIPAFNCADTIENCLTSVLGQTYRKLDVVVVDDGSIDKTAEVVEFIARQDQRVRLFCKENGGVSSARNLGLDNARGKYVAFVDADDMIEPEMVEKLLAACIETDSDVACCGFLREKDGRWMPEHPLPDDRIVLNRREFLLGVISGCKGNHLIGGYLCNKLFASSLLQRVRLESGRAVCEDLLAVLEAGQSVNRACCVREALYRYSKTQGSATRSLDTLITPDGDWAYFEVAQIVYRRYSTTSALKRAARLSICGAAVNGLMHLVGNSEYRSLYDELRAYAKSEWDFYRSNLTPHQKARTYLVIFRPAIYNLLKRIGGSRVS